MLKTIFEGEKMDYYNSSVHGLGITLQVLLGI